MYPAIAQKLTFQQMGARQGLPASEVYNIQQDQRGYVWAFTEYGMVRHNGTRFRPICKNLPFAETIVYKVTMSPGGTMYFANSRANIYRIQGDSAVRIKGLEAISQEILDNNQVIFDLAIDSDSAIFFSTSVMSWKLDQRTGKVCKLSKPGKTNEIIFRPVGNRFITQKSFRPNYTDEVIYNLKVFPEDGGRPFNILSVNYWESRNMLIKSGDRYVIMSTNEVITVSRDGTVQRAVLPKSSLTMQVAPNGHIWVGLAYGGVIELSADLRILNHYFEDEAVSGILFDWQGSLWVSTIDKGIFYCKNSRNGSYNHVPMLDDCISLLKRVDGRLFVGTTKGNLFVYEKGEMRPVDLGMSKSPLTDLVRLGDHYFVTMKHAILRMDLHLRNVCSLSPIFGGYALAESANHRLVVASSTRLLICEKKGTSIKQCMPSGKPRYIICRGKRDLFIGMRNGLQLLKNERTVLPDYLKPLFGMNISNLKTDGGTGIWICTKGNGLFWLSSENKLKHYTGLPSVVVTDVCSLPGNVVVLATNKGVFATTLKNGRFSPWRPLLEEETVNIEQHQGKLYIGTKNGLIVRDISHLLYVREYPFYLRSVVVDGETANHRDLYFSHSENNMYFNFDMLAYELSYKQLFYRLEGPSPGSGKVNGTQLHLQNLLPGRYVLHAHPYNYLTHTHQSGRMLVFYIAPAFWQTNIFLGSVVFTCILLIVGSTWMIFYRMRRREATRSRISRLLAGYRLTALKAQINPHFISNSLSAIQQLILRNDTDRANQYMAKFSLLIRYLLNYSDKAVASLGSEIRIIDLDVELEQLRFSDKFVFRKEIAKNVNPELCFIPPLITQPFIENAIWHGLLPLSDNRVPELILRVTLEEDYLTISIIDNGVGRPKSLRNPAESVVFSGDKESRGTNLIRSRLGNLNLLHTTANGAEIELIDLEDEQGKPTGTRVNIVFSVEMLNKLYDEQDQEHYY